MNIADKLKSNIVVIPVVASIVVGSFTGIKYVLNLTNTINSNNINISLSNRAKFFPIS